MKGFKAETAQPKGKNTHAEKIVKKLEVIKAKRHSLKNN